MSGNSPPATLVNSTALEITMSVPATASPIASPTSPTTSPSTADIDELLTVDEVAAILKCDVEAVYNLTRQRSQARSENPIPTIHLQIGLRFSAMEIREWIKSQRLAERAKQRAARAPHKEAA
jgi:Helix-turn-helix domain